MRCRRKQKADIDYGAACRIEVLINVIAMACTDK